MLGKLLKYDFKAFLRIMVPFYLALMVLSLLAGLSQGWITTDFNTENSPLTIIWVVGLVLVLTVNIIVVVQRFRDNLLKNEGYLMFTLPVTRRQLLVSKVLTALVSLLISGLVLILSVLLFGALFDLSRLEGWLSEVLQYITGHTSFLLAVLVALITMFQQISLIYTVLLGSQILPRFRALAALGAYILVMYVQVQISIAITPHFPQETYSLLLGQGAIGIVFAGLYFSLCGWLLHHTLNLE
jgi:uncharacterized membrane protein YhaH (DUF805 family)